LGVAWYSNLFGREPPPPHGRQHRLTETSAVMVDDDADRAAGGNLIVGVADLDAQAAELYEREIVLVSCQAVSLMNSVLVRSAQ
jgi:hypothetical protein